MALVQLEPGTVFARDYRVLSLLSQGGMGAVYVVEQLSTGAQRALKIMLPQLVSDIRHRRRFEQEARIGARIESDHVVQVIGAGIDPRTATPWLAMELLRGEDLASLIASRGPRPLSEVSAILEQVCHALGAAHRAGIVHRDIKPENIFLSAARRADAESEVKILDFGVARMMAEAFYVSGTRNIGSPMWMSPEQTNHGDRVGPAADVWALGLLAFHLLTGIYFWHAANTDAPLGALLREIVLNDIPSATRRAAEYGVDGLLPPRFNSWFSRCVHRDASARFQDASTAFEVFWATVNDATPLPVEVEVEDEDDLTTVDFSDRTTTLSSIPPAAPHDLAADDPLFDASPPISFLSTELPSERVGAACLLERRASFACSPSTDARDRGGDDALDLSLERLPLVQGEGRGRGCGAGGRHIRPHEESGRPTEAPRCPEPGDGGEGTCRRCRRRPAGAPRGRPSPDAKSSERARRQLRDGARRERGGRTPEDHDRRLPRDRSDGGDRA